MGRGAIHDGGVALWQDDGVQGVRVTGTGDVLHLKAPLLRLGRYPLHQGRFPAAGPSFQDQDILRLQGVHKLVIE